MAVPVEHHHLLKNAKEVNNDDVIFIFPLIFSPHQLIGTLSIGVNSVPKSDIGND